MGLLSRLSGTESSSSVPRRRSPRNDRYDHGCRRSHSPSEYRRNSGDHRRRSRHDYGGSRRRPHSRNSHSPYPYRHVPDHRSSRRYPSRYRPLVSSPPHQYYGYGARNGANYYDERRSAAYEARRRIEAANARMHAADAARRAMSRQLQREELARRASFPASTAMAGAGRRRNRADPQRRLRFSGMNQVIF